MAEAIWLCMAVVAALLGMGWLSLSLDVHWRQVVAVASSRLPVQPGPRLRLMGALSLLASLFFCLFADHASMAVLVWVMLTASSAVTIAMTLTWQPRCLRLLALPWSSNAMSAGR